jgi:hypothetical protein
MLARCARYLAICSFTRLVVLSGQHVPVRAHPGGKLLVMTREILLFATLLAVCASVIGAYLFAVLTQ